MSRHVLALRPRSGLSPRLAAARSGCSSQIRLWRAGRATTAEMHSTPAPFLPFSSLQQQSMHVASSPTEQQAASHEKGP